tara:strand:+ start:2616 stop:2852 length:237 start_codon:yes stop_codon:yes gene_type:complete
LLNQFSRPAKPQGKRQICLYLDKTGIIPFLLFSLRDSSSALLNLQEPSHEERTLQQVAVVLGRPVISIQNAEEIEIDQ